VKRQFTQMWIAITQDGKKAAVLGALVLVALVLWARATILSSGPRQAQAGADAAESSGSSAPSGDRALWTDDGSDEVAATKLPAVEPLHRDFFTPSESYFPKSSQTDSSDEETPKFAGGTDETSDESRSPREQHARSVQERAERLRLRSTVVGAQPYAVIQSTSFEEGRGKVFSVGDVVDGLNLIEIASDHVVLEHSGVRVTLRLKLQSAG